MVEPKVQFIKWFNTINAQVPLERWSGTWFLRGTDEVWQHLYTPTMSTVPKEGTDGTRNIVGVFKIQ